MPVKSCKRTSLLTVSTLLLLSILLTSVTPWGVVWLSSWLLSITCALCTSSLPCLLPISTLVISCISLLLIALRSLKIEMGLSQIFPYFHFLQKKTLHSRNFKILKCLQAVHMHFAAVHMHLHLLTGRTHCSLKRGETVKHNKQQTMLPISVFEFLNIGVKI